MLGMRFNHAFAQSNHALSSGCAVDAKRRKAAKGNPGDFASLCVFWSLASFASFASSHRVTDAAS